MRKFLGYNIISDEELNRLIEDARNEQRNMNNAFIAKLFRNAEYYRRVAGAAAIGGPRIRTIEESRKKSGG